MLLTTACVLQEAQKEQAEEMQKGAAQTKAEMATKAQRATRKGQRVTRSAAAP
jgi:hypothetical protein